MVVDDDGSKWLRPLKLREYFVDHSVDDAMHAEKKLYLAVVCGEVRARRNGRLLGPEWLRQFRNMKPIPTSPSPCREIWSCRRKMRSGSGRPANGTRNSEKCTFSCVYWFAFPLTPGGNAAL
jgi:hypothetical protein